MRFKQIVHPEIVYGTRGPEHLIATYKAALPKFEWMSDISRFGCKDTNFLNSLDINTRDHLCIIKKFQHHSGKTFHVNRDFLQEIAKVKRAIPVDILPQRFVGFFSFALDTLADDSGFIQGGYIYVGPSDETTFSQPDPKKKVIWISYLNQGDKITVTSLRKTIDEIIEMKDLEMGEDYHYGFNRSDFGSLNSLEAELKIGDTQAREIIYRTLLNLVCYVHQPDPTIQKAPPTKDLTHSQRSARRNTPGAVYNEATLPITFINWGWTRPQSEHTVSGHLKWQSFGPARAQRKLIWVDAYIRNEGKS